MFAFFLKKHELVVFCCTTAYTKIANQETAGNEKTLELTTHPQAHTPTWMGYVYYWYLPTGVIALKYNHTTNGFPPFAVLS